MNYKRIKYPDGQIGAEIVNITHPYIINERINSYEDLFFIKSICDALDFANVKNRHLVIPCLFGQRSDRRFLPTNSFDLKIIADFINSCGFMDVKIFDPHSDVSLALIHNSSKVSPVEKIELAIKDINEDIILISPDAGAYKKVFEIGQKFNMEVTAAVKHRDLAGKIELKFIGDVKGKNCLILDDLCDGGYTFVMLSQQLKDQGANNIYLYVSHGYFSKGFDELKKNIKKIYCTNSVKDVNDEFVKQFKIV